MKIYQAKPSFLIRIQFKKVGELTEYLTLCETTMDAVEELCKKIILNLKHDPLKKGKSTSIHIREAKGGINGKSKSFSFKGYTPKEILEAIKTQVNTIEK